MTFTEAAVQVLRAVGRPLHYKKITEMAIEQNLLSHVGKTPEVTMSSRLATMVRKDRGEAPIVKVKPGIFGLREFSEDVLQNVDVEVSEEDEKLEAEALKRAVGALGERSDETAAPESDDESVEPASAHGELPMGADVFPEEEDDDEPILGGSSQGGSSQGNSSEGGDDDNSRSKRGRKRRRRDGKRDGRAEAGQRDTSSHESSRESSKGSGRGRSRSREMGEGVSPSDLADLELADAIELVLKQRPDAPQSVPLSRVAELLIQKDRLAGTPAALVPTIAASLRGDTARRAAMARPPRFRIDATGVALAAWFLPDEVARAEESVLAQAEKQQKLVHRAFIRMASELSPGSLMELMATWLNAEGVVALRAVRKPGAKSGEFHLAGTLKVGHESTGIAIFILPKGPVTREHIIELRGALHHYGQASSAWVITFGNIDASAREEASAPLVAPCLLLDGDRLALAMEKAGVGLLRSYVPLVSLDLDLVDALFGRDAVGRQSRGADNRSERGRSAERRADSGESSDSERSDGQSRSRRRRRRRGRGSSDSEESADGSTKSSTNDSDEKGAKDAVMASDPESEPAKGNASRTDALPDDSESQEQSKAEEGAVEPLEASGEQKTPDASDVDTPADSGITPRA